jgi:hypothetical protein
MLCDQHAKVANAPTSAQLVYANRIVSLVSAAFLTCIIGTSAVVVVIRCFWAPFVAAFWANNHC